MTQAIYTIGHSTHSIELFLKLLIQHDISAVADVRSCPYSRMNPQFNRETLKGSLRKIDKKYVFLGKELGARPEDKSCYLHGQVQFDRLAKTDLFKSGLDRVMDGSKTMRIALMCAEKEPLDCHRTILVARHLEERGMSVKHILFDGSIEEHADAIERLIARKRISGVDMFRAKEAVVLDAYKEQRRNIAYREETETARRDTTTIAARAFE